MLFSLAKDMDSQRPYVPIARAAWCDDQPTLEDQKWSFLPLGPGAAQRLRNCDAKKGCFWWPHADTGTAISVSTPCMADSLIVSSTKTSNSDRIKHIRLKYLLLS